MSVIRSVVNPVVRSVVNRNPPTVSDAAWVPPAYSETQQWFAAMSSYADPSVGTATRSFSRNFGVSQLQSNGTYNEAAHQTAAYQWSPSLGRNVHKSTNLIAGSIAFGTNRDLTGANWTIANGTRVRNQTGVDGTANSCTFFGANANNATLTNARTATSSARTFSAFVKRITGTGDIQLTCDGGTSWTTVTVPTGSSWTRVSLTQTVANPTFGFRLVTSGDAIAIDCACDVPFSYAVDPFISRTDQQQSNLIYSSITPTLEPNRRYLATVKHRLLGESSANITIGVVGTNSVRVQMASGGTAPWNIASFSGSTLRVNSSVIQTGATAINNQIGDVRTIGLSWGRGKVQYSLDGVTQNTVDTVGAPDPLSMSRLEVFGNGEYWDLEVKEIFGQTLCLLGDSITASSDYTKRFLNNLDQKKYDVFRRGVSGNTILDVAARVGTDVTPVYNSRTNNNVVLLWIGTNSIAANVSGATALTQLSSLVTTLKGGGWRVYCIKTLPRGGGFVGTDAAGFATQAAIYNAGMSSVGADKVIDLNTVPESQDFNNLTYYDSFKIHPTDALYALFWPIIEAAIDY